MSGARILIVDDEPAQMKALCDTLRDHDYLTTGFTDGRTALEALRAERFDLLLADLMMPGMDGINLLAAAQQADHDLVGIIMTGEGTISSAVEAMKAGALDYILKPFKLSAILPVLARALAVRDLRLANAELERSVRQRTLELETANAELEAFSFSISHDLRSPLTVVLGKADMLIDDPRIPLPPAARPLVDDIIAGAERMRQLIDDLLRLSRLGRQPVAKEPIRVRDVVQDVLQELGPAHLGRVEVRIGALPDCVGDAGLIKQVFTNLLANAFKFTRGKQPAVVELECRQENGQKIYSVRDNGAGFEMRRANELFRAFQRLHTADQFEGTGVGLSIVHRIVERHGGRVWADAEPGKGAAFHFSVPE